MGKIISCFNLTNHQSYCEINSDTPPNWINLLLLNFRDENSSQYNHLLIYINQLHYFPCVQLSFVLSHQETNLTEINL